MSDEIGVREPSESELEYLKHRPNVGGMATEDHMVILNPYSQLTKEQEGVVVKNERARVFMKKHNIRPSFTLTPQQKQYFFSISNGIPYGTEQDIRETIVGRMIAGDLSSGQTTPEQEIFKSLLEGMMG